MILCEGPTNINYNNPGRGGTGESGNIKSWKDHDGAEGWELSRPTTICCEGNNAFHLFLNYVLHNKPKLWAGRRAK